MEKAEATVRDDDFHAMLERIRQKAANRKNVVALPTPPEDGIICKRCGNTGWIEVNQDGHCYMDHCRHPESIRRTTDGTPWRVLTGSGARLLQRC